MSDSDRIDKVLIDRPGVLNVRFTARGKHASHGRFGGGWQYVLGVEVGKLYRDKGCVIVNLLVAYVRINYGRYAC